MSETVIFGSRRYLLAISVRPCKPHSRKLVGLFLLHNKNISVCPIRTLVSVRPCDGVLALRGIESSVSVVVSIRPTERSSRDPSETRRRALSPTLPYPKESVRCQNMDAYRMLAGCQRNGIRQTALPQTVRVGCKSICSATRMDLSTPPTVRYFRLPVIIHIRFE